MEAQHSERRMRVHDKCDECNADSGVYKYNSCGGEALKRNIGYSTKKQVLSIVCSRSWVLPRTATTETLTEAHGAALSLMNRAVPRDGHY